MSHIYVDIPSGTSSGPGSGTIDPAPLATIDTTENFTIPANAHGVFLHCMGGPNPNAPSTLNGSAIYPGWKWESDVPISTALTIVTNGVRWVGGYQL